MAILNTVIREGNTGIAKQIEASALSLIFDNVQKNQYQYPEKSTIRELFSNAHDAINEKVTYLKIAKGAKVADFYLTRNDPMFADSNYLPEYYDKNWMHSNNRVEITFTENAGGMRDSISIKDRGVGIGHIINPLTNQSRLQGVIKLGYSSKRNSAKQLGKFGIGAKAALSTGIDSYTMITRHNGKEYRFEIYDYKADSIVPAFNMETGQKNPTFEFHSKEGELEYIGHYLHTEEKNGTEIILQAKKFARSIYLDAVKSQLLYFNDLDFNIIRESGVKEFIPVEAEVLYRDEFILITKNDQFGKPHYVLNGVNYGPVDFLRMELEEKRGNIAYLLDPDKVTVHPSRESLIYDETTRKTTLEVQQKITEIATDLIGKELRETDLIKWVRKCAQIVGTVYDPDSITGKLLSQVDKELLKPVYLPDPKIRFYKEPNLFFFGMEAISVYGTSSMKDGKSYIKLSRAKIRSWSDLDKKLYVQVGETSNKLEQYLIQLNPSGFTKLKVRNLISGFQEGSEMNEKEVNLYRKLQQDDEFKTKWEKEQQEFLKRLLASEEVEVYDEVIVPKEIEEKIEEKLKEEKAAAMTPAQKREAQGKTVLVYPQITFYHSDRNFSFTKEEPIIQEILDYEGTLVYGFQEDEELIHVVANIMLPKGNVNPYEFYNSDFKLVRISKTAAKYYKNHCYIKDFLLSIHVETKTIAMHSKLVMWHTARKIDEALTRMKFLNNYQAFNQTITYQYHALVEYKNKYYNDLKGSTKFGCNETALADFNEFADKIIDLQMYIEEHSDPLAVAAQSRYLFETPEGEDTFEQAVGVDMEIYKTLKAVLEYIAPLEHLFNYIKPLTDGGQITPELERELRAILAFKQIT